MRGLAHCQMNFMEVVLMKINRKSKPIKKQEKIVNENLKRKRIFLEEDDFDILQVLQKDGDCSPVSTVQPTPEVPGGLFGFSDTCYVEPFMLEGANQAVSNGHQQSSSAFPVSSVFNNSKQVTPQGS